MNKKITIIKRTDRTVPQINFTPIKIHSDLSTIHEKIQNHLLNRCCRFKIEMTTDVANRYSISRKKLPETLIDLACTKHTPFVNNDFDYLRHSIKSFACKIFSSNSFVELNFELCYHTNFFQEEQIDSFLRNLYDDCGVYALKSHYMKAKFVYDYIIENVEYDHCLANVSAYDALIKKKAVCSGCATLLYRMLSMLGIPCRIITGYGMSESHAWNIISIDGIWYNADVTWDLCKNRIQRRLSLYDYFLIGESNFKQHIKNPEFVTQSFKANYPMSIKNYK